MANLYIVSCAVKDERDERDRGRVRSNEYYERRNRRLIGVKEVYAVADDPTGAEKAVKEVLGNNNEVYYVENIRLIASTHVEEAPDLLTLTN